jgi:hypothetical protein
MAHTVSFWTALHNTFKDMCHDGYIFFSLLLSTAYMFFTLLLSIVYLLIAIAVTVTYLLASAFNPLTRALLMTFYLTTAMVFDVLLEAAVYPPVIFTAVLFAEMIYHDMFK